MNTLLFWGRFVNLCLYSLLHDVIKKEYLKMK